MAPPWKVQAAAASQGEHSAAMVPATMTPSATQQTNWAPPVNASDGSAAGSYAATSYIPAASKKKQTSVVEMLEYVKGLDIDPIQEADMLWIAEEAFSAPLPPAWGEHTDEQGRVYYHNCATGDSSWSHPMDDMFREIVRYHRRVVASGGFWEIEDEMATMEESIRRDLADWMELFDEHGEKFFYSRKTQESRFDDPRMGVYHILYARIKMVAKMKERLPMLARNTRPDEPSPQEVELRRRQEQEEVRYKMHVIRIQSFCRALIAKRRVRQAMSQSVVQKGPQPLRGKLRLRIEKTGNLRQKELVLSQTTPHRRNAAARKIQARVRGIQARKKFRPLVLHRAYLSKLVTKVQCRARIVLARKQLKRMRVARRAKAATDIQRIFRGYCERKYVSALMGQKSKFKWMLKCVVLIQAGMRMALAWKEVKRRRALRYTSNAVMLQRQSRMHLARKELMRCDIADNPIQVCFKLETNQQLQILQPFVWQLWMAPAAAQSGGGGSKSPSKRSKYVDLFEKPANDWDAIAATKWQARIRGMLARRRIENSKNIGKSMIYTIYQHTWDTITLRQRSATRIKAAFRGWKVRRQNLLVKLFQEHIDKNLKQITKIQAHITRKNKQGWLQHGFRTVHATQIQAAWRGKMARGHVEMLKQEALWPMKGWFEYTGTGREAVQVEVRWLPNPSFDDFQYFCNYGNSDELREALQAMHREVQRSTGNFLSEERELNTPKPLSPRDPLPSEEVSRPQSAVDSIPEDIIEGSAPGNLAPDKDSEDPPPVPATDSPSEPSAEANVTRPIAKTKGPKQGLSPSPKRQGLSPSPSRPQKNDKQAESTQLPAEDSLTQNLTQNQTHDLRRPNQSEFDSVQESGRKGGKKKRQDARDLEAGSGLGDFFAPETSARSDPSPSSGRPPRPAKKAMPISPGKSKLVRESDPQSHAHQILRHAPKRYKDQRPHWSPEPPRATTPSPPPVSDLSLPAIEANRQVSSMKQSQSAPELQGDRQTYGGKMVNGVFVKTHKATVDELTEAEKKAVFDDIEADRQKKIADVAERNKRHTKRKCKEEQDKVDKHKSMVDAHQQEEEERKHKKVEQLTKWLDRKKTEDKARRDRDKEVMRQVLLKEEAKSEAFQKLEQARLEERERRLKIAEKRKARTEQQLGMGKMSAADQTMQELMIKREQLRQMQLMQLQQQQLLQQQQQQSGQQIDQTDQSPAATAVRHRVVHRHIHHHVHYHEGDEDQDGELTPGAESQAAAEQDSKFGMPQGHRRGIENASEGRVRAQLEQSHAMDAGHAMRQFPAGHSASLGALHSSPADAPQMRRVASDGAVGEIDYGAVQDTIKGKKLDKYSRNINRAFGSYADAGRPQYGRKQQAGFG